MDCLPKPFSVEQSIAAGVFMDRYQLSKSFNLELFERTILQCTDVAELQNMCIKLHSTVHSQRCVYEAMLRDFKQLP